MEDLMWVAILVGLSLLGLVLIRVLGDGGEGADA